MNVTLHNGNLTAVISSLGAELRSLKDAEGNEYIWNRDPAFWDRSAPYLFPTVGNVRGGKLTIKGREYEMGQHGFCRDYQWDVAVLTPFSVTFTFHENEETLKRYPYTFAMAIKYTLTGSSLETEIEISNTGKEEMYFCFGTHPAINVPFQNSPGSVFSDYSVIFDKPELNSSPLYNHELNEINMDDRVSLLDDEKGFRLNYDTFDKVKTMIFDHSNSEKLLLLDNKTGRALEVRYRNFDYIAFWTARRDAPFVCVEPWQGCAVCADEDGSLEDKHGVKKLAPYTAEKFYLDFEIK